MLDAFAAVRRRVPATLWILGEGPQRPALERRMRELDLAPDVCLAGFRPDPAAWMAQADLFVLSSRWEGFANVVVEAMAGGTPVVATDCPHGPGEIVEDGVSGLLVPPEDATALAAAIERRALAERLASAGRRRAKVFSSPAAAQSYGELFERLGGVER